MDISQKKKKTISNFDKIDFRKNNTLSIWIDSYRLSIYLGLDNLNIKMWYSARQP